MVTVFIALTFWNLFGGRDRGFATTRISASSLNLMFLSGESLDKREDIVKIPKLQETHPSKTQW
jgi:hypothetical protein